MDKNDCDKVLNAMITADKHDDYNNLLTEIGSMVENAKKNQEDGIDTEIATTMRELRQFIERLRRVKDGEI